MSGRRSLPNSVGMNVHPSRVEIGDDTVEVDSESHRHTLRMMRVRQVRTMRTLAVLFVVTATACGGNSTGTVRSYSIGLEVEDGSDRYRFIATDEVDVRVGDEVTFELENTGTLIHDLQVVDPEGNRVAYAEPTAPGADATLTVLFEEDGFFRLNCLVDDHLTEHDMQTFFEVTDPSG